jgi:AcrR family transcriptional regulator
MPAPRIDRPGKSRTKSAGKTKLQAVPALLDPPEVASPRRRGRPPRLSRPAIFRAALRLIDAEGAGALTMRRLGAEMGVEAMSLYRHISSKDALLDGIAEQLMAEHEIAPDGQDWALAACGFAVKIRSIARAHPAAFELVGLRALNTVDAMRPVEAVLAALCEGGFAPDRAVAAFRLLSGYSRGFALSEIAGFTLTRANHGLTGMQLPADEFPAIHELADELARNPTDDDFRAGVETIIAGLRIELAATAPGRRAGAATKA